MTAPYELPRYPAIRFFIARGRLIAAAVATLCVLGGFGAWAAYGLAWAAPVGIALGALLGGLMLCFTELLAIVAETLMPR